MSEMMPEQVPTPAIPAVPGWPCEAYGPRGIDVGLFCFFSDQYQRQCAFRLECSLNMALERQRLFREIQRGAAAGDPVFTWLAAGITSPDELLGGSLSPSIPDEEG